MPVPNARPPRNAHDFEDTVALPPADRLQNVNNFTFLGLLAVLADRKFRLWKRESDALGGKLTYDKEMKTPEEEGQGAQGAQGGGGGGGGGRPPRRWVEWKG